MHHTQVRENRALSEFPQNLALDLRDKLTSWINAADLGPIHLKRAELVDDPELEDRLYT